ncbi:ATP-binding protein [Staphylococcus massiliensis]|uniref:DNA polymerase III subunit delta' n=1 Tax=Staphylococcus massiliensis S46 TaxID=1229783 RepID=K9AX88_9STAP|nr:DNA polymerase III subunit delta' C-terminal domain-containing protein [Staphylococcus massiliensis]EKU46140.1 DNA polymerase III delta prime subunit [Staphylococcus massiliensis S46]MCG3400521.1 DNA polymerase III subunit delta' [Staphylococcus massiliensis]MCG3402821.1 DNA polymerase III subunit delta' [Staphylococcus massiliensis]MCG3413218.1 DNA polymerase III subunit delta' [Staphylococcus massiliensis]POA01969.1 DNA polymerase III subunit delta' [Staphylococcus massiliensis CCUG 55927
MDELTKLTHAYHDQKLSHAYLFEGDDARSMKSVAINFAKTILCDSDETCELKVENLNHPDFMYVETNEITIKKEQVEALVRYMNRLPIESTHKVYIIDGFEKLTVQGENSILKFLEEPPNNTIAILISTKPEQILDTIHSRCQHVYFKPMDTKQVIEHFKSVEISPGVAEILGTYTTDQEIAIELNKEFDLAALRKETLNWCHLLIENRPMALIAIVELLKQAKNRKLQILVLTLMNTYFQDVMHMKADLKSAITLTSIQEHLEGVALKLSYQDLTTIHETLLEAHKKLNQNVNPTLVFEQIAIRIKG